MQCAKPSLPYQTRLSAEHHRVLRSKAKWRLGRSRPRILQRLREWLQSQVPAGLIKVVNWWCFKVNRCEVTSCKLQLTNDAPTSEVMDLWRGLRRSWVLSMHGTVESGIFDGTVWFYGNYRHINFIPIIYLKILVCIQTTYWWQGLNYA